MILLLIPAALWLVFGAAASAEDWTRFRGPNGLGISTASGYPTELGKDKSLIWRTPVRPGKSSPILTSKHVFLTGFDKGKLYTQCFDARPASCCGNEAWTRLAMKWRTA